MLHLLVDHTWEVLVPHHVALLAQLADVYPAPKVGVGHDVGHVKIHHLELGRQRLLDVFDGALGGLLGIGLRLRADDDHAAGLEDENGALGLGLPHDDGGEALLVVAAALHLLRDEFEIEVILDVHLRKRHHVLNQRKVGLIDTLIHP